MRKFIVLSSLVLVTSFSWAGPYPRILFAGNSLTLHPPNPAVEWYGNYGMAASSEDSDYVAHVSASLEASSFRRLLTSSWETRFYQDSVRWYVSEIDTVAFDLMVVFVGDMLNQDTALAYDFQSHFHDFLQGLRQFHPSARLITVTKFWPNQDIDSMIITASAPFGAAVADISSLSSDTLNFAYTERPYAVHAVGIHPGDRGHRHIADAILEALSRTDGLPAPLLPPSPALAQNFPNPFNPSTTIEFSLPAAGPVHLAVFDLLGRRVRTLLSGNMQPGVYRVTFEAAGLAAGVYVCRLETEGLAASRKMLLLR